MLIVTADIGTYSIKILTSRIEKSQIIHLNGHELVLNFEEQSSSTETPRWSQQQRVLKHFLDELATEYYLILNAPSDLFTTRFVELPIKQKKKALQMIPFKLEEDIPFSLSDCHFGTSLRSINDKSEATVNIARKSEFVTFYNVLRQNHTIPKILTTEVSIYETYVAQNKDLFPSSFCIVDIGHHSTKAYYFNEWKLVVAQHSFLAGNAITEIISESYDISLEEATIYKHQNCFLLTQDQYEGVSADQRHFAQIMEQTFHPLINEIRRWELGYRIQHGVRIKEVFLIGGSANIKNIANFFTEQLGVKTTHLNTFDHMSIPKLDADPKYRRKFSTTNVISHAYKYKSKVINLLSGDFANEANDEIPLHSLAFIATRSAIITCLLLMSLMVERFFINRDLNNLNQHISSLVKNPILDLTNRQKRLALSTPDVLYSKFSKGKKVILQEVNTLQSAVKINAINSLNTLAKVLTGEDLELIQFESTNQGPFNGIIKVNKKENLKKVVSKLENSGINEIFVESDEKTQLITISGVAE